MNDPRRHRCFAHGERTSERKAQNAARTRTTILVGNIIATHGRCTMKELAAKLEAAERFVEAATIVCDEAKRLGLYQCGVLLHRTSGPAVLAVDNFPEATDEHRLLAVSQYNWDHNPWFITLREHLGTIGAETIDPIASIALARQHGYTGATYYPLVSPVIGPHGWFATVLYSSLEPVSVRLERDLAMIATHLSVWCTQHGVGAVPDVRPTHRLTPRQHRIARLAASGYTNEDIAEALAISVNTVKARLKQAFERLDVTNRIELAGVIKLHAPPDEVAPGVTHLETVAVTRAL